MHNITGEEWEEWISLPQTRMMLGALNELMQRHVESILASEGEERVQYIGRVKCIREDVIPLMKGERHD